MITKYSIRVQYQKRLEKYRRKTEKIPAFLGDGDGNLRVSTDSPYLMYARLLDGTVIQVWNFRTLGAWNDAVWVGYDEDDPYRLVVLKERSVFAIPTNWGVPFHDHEIGGPNPTWVWSQQFMPWLVVPIDDFIVKVYKNTIFTGTIYIAGGTEQIDMTDHIPVSGALYSLIQVNRLTGIVSVKDGDPVADTTVLLDQNIPLPDDFCVPLAAIRLYEAQTKLEYGDPATTDVADLRNFNFSGSGQNQTAAPGDVGDVMFKGDNGFLDAVANLTFDKAQLLLRIGDTANPIPFAAVPSLEITKLGARPVILLAAWSEEDGDAGQVIGYSASGKPDPDGALWESIGDDRRLVSIVGTGYAGSGYNFTGGRFRLSTNQAWSPTAAGTKAQIFICKNDGIVETEVFRIDGDSIKFYIPFDVPEIDPAGTPAAGFGRLSVDPSTKHLIFTDSDDTVTDLMDSSGGTWGSITGTLSAQTDLQAALDAKVAGPGTLTDNHIARFDGTTGKIIQDSAITIGDDGNIYLDTGAALIFNQLSTDLPTPAASHRALGFRDDGRLWTRDETGTHAKFLLDAEAVLADGSNNPLFLTVKNTSGATAAAGDVGVLVYTTGAGWEYQTTTTAIDTRAEAGCVVIVGAANGSDVKVAKRGRFTIPYSGTAPAAGDWLVFSATATKIQQQTTMRPEVIAMAMAAGTGGLVDALLMIGRVTRDISASVDLFNCTSCSDWNWTGTINGAPSGANVTVTTTGGTNLNSIVPNANNHLGKVVLHNTTRGTDALIDSVSGSVVTLTANAPAGWVNGDIITTKSQTNTDNFSGGGFYYDIDLSSSDNIAIPINAVSIDVFGTVSDSGTGFMSCHPYETGSLSKRANWLSQTASRWSLPGIPLIGQRFCIGVDASGSATMTALGRIRRALLAVP